METDNLTERLYILDHSLVFLSLIILSTLLSFVRLTKQRGDLCRLLRGESLPASDSSSLALTASALLVGSLGYFFCLAVSSARSAAQGDRSAAVNLQASALVFLAALLRLGELLEEK